MSWFNTIEEHQVGAIFGYQDERRARYLVKFVDGESYVYVYFSAWDSANSGERDIDLEDPRYDESFQMGQKIVETVQTGSRRYDDGLSLDCRDFPARIACP